MNVNKVILSTLFVFGSAVATEVETIENKSVLAAVKNEVPFVKHWYVQIPPVSVLKAKFEEMDIDQGIAEKIGGKRVEVVHGMDRSWYEAVENIARKDVKKAGDLIELIFQNDKAVSKLIKKQVCLLFEYSEDEIEKIKGFSKKEGIAFQKEQERKWTLLMVQFVKDVLPRFASGEYKHSVSRKEEKA